jgi:hypothetical protein
MSDGLKATWLRTARHGEAEDKIRQAFRLLGDARTVMTAYEFTEFVSQNLAQMPEGLGGQGFVASIGEMITKGADSQP